MALLPEELAGLNVLQASRAQVVKQIARNIGFLP